MLLGASMTKNIQTDTYKILPTVKTGYKLAHKKKIISQLFEIDAIAFGNFTLKSGIQSPIYIDMRRIISFPALFDQITSLFAQEITCNKSDYLCAVPYGALPIATGVAIKCQKPSLMARKISKDYGQKKSVEGIYKQNDTVTLIEDIITSGASILQTISTLKKEGLHIHDVFVFLDREQGGKKRLEQQNVRLHALCTLSDVLTFLYDEGKINESTRNRVQQFIAENQFS